MLSETYEKKKLLFCLEVLKGLLYAINERLLLIKRNLVVHHLISIVNHSRTFGQTLHKDASLFFLISYSFQPITSKSNVASIL